MNLEKWLEMGYQLIMTFGPKLIAAILIWVFGSWAVNIIVKGLIKTMDKRDYDLSLKKFITNLTSFMGHLVSAKQIIIVALNRVKSIGTFKKTDKGFEAVNPEGYVAIDRSGKAVKLVDRMEFAFNNFTAIKNWDK